MRFLIPLLAMLLIHGGAHAQQPLCHDLTAPPPLSGGPADTPLCDWFDARAVLIVNTASQCGYTPQFKGLEALHQRYRDRGLVILGFPSDNFGGQEYAQPEKTADVCYRNYGVSFPMFRKIDVRGDGAHPLFKRLAAASHPPAWNFHKYLVTADGVQDFRSGVAPESATLIQAIEQALLP